MTWPVGIVAIVKNEEKALPRMLDSTLSFAQAWVICDTGSTDATLEAGIDWELSHQTGRFHFTDHEWQDFSHNRNLALDIARRTFPEVKYWLSVDADETVRQNREELSDRDGRPLSADLVGVDMDYTNCRYWNGKLVKAKGPCRWVGRVHEHLTAPDYVHDQVTDALTIVHHFDGYGTREGKRLERNLALLEKDLADNPNDSRTLFYMGNTLDGLGRWLEAAEYFERRATMPHIFEEEGWFATYRWGAMLLRAGDTRGVDILLRAWERRPTRGEPLAELATFYANQNMQRLASSYIQAAEAIPYPENDVVFVEEMLYRPELRPSGE